MILYLYRCTLWLFHVSRWPLCDLIVTLNGILMLVSGKSILLALAPSWTLESPPGLLNLIYTWIYNRLQNSHVPRRFLLPTSSLLHSQSLHPTLLSCYCFLPLLFSRPIGLSITWPCLLHTPGSFLITQVLIIITSGKPSHPSTHQHPVITVTVSFSDSLQILVAFLIANVLLIWLW